MVYGNDFSEIPTGTAIETQEAINQNGLKNLVRYLALSQIAIAATQIKFTSQDEALQTRDELADKIEEEIIKAADVGKDEVYRALSGLKVSVIQDINQRAVLLPNISYVKIDDSVPALVLAYGIYGDAKKDQEIVERNHVRNPTFMPMKQELEVLL